MREESARSRRPSGEVELILRTSKCPALVALDYVSTKECLNMNMLKLLMKGM